MSSWLTFPTLDASAITIRLDGVNTDYTLVPVSTYDGIDLGPVANELAIIRASATVGGLVAKVRTVPLWWRVEKVFETVVTPVIPPELSPNPNIVQTMNALWTDDGNVRTGGYVYAPPTIADLNIIPVLGTPTGSRYRLSVATPLVWVDGVQVIVRFAELQAATFEY